MKKVLLLALAIVCGVAFSDNFAKKPKKQEVSAEEQMMRDSLAQQELKEKQRRDSLIAQLEREMQMEEELRRAKLEELRSKAAVAKEEIPLPCQEDAQSNDEYYCALGISDEEFNSSSAVQEAMQKAQLELAQAIGGESVELNNVEVVCREILRNSRGLFSAYVAIRMPKKQQ